jgi:hypothetical protein
MNVEMERPQNHHNFSRDQQLTRNVDPEDPAYQRRLIAAVRSN